MENRHSCCAAGQAAFFAFLGGALAGAVAGILLAPKSGEETRRELRGYARRTEEEVLEKAKEARTALDEMIEKGKQYMTERKADVEAAIRAGKEAMKDRREKGSS